MTLDELKKQMELDLPIKLVELQSEAANNPVLYGKWNRILADLSKVNASLSKQKKLIMSERLKYYTGRGDDVCLDVFSATELKTIISGDPEVIDISVNMDINDIKIELCRNAMEAIKQRGFAIRAVVDCRKLEAGE